eukprot:14583637-Heterocapsa_arctica.AAC.1
MMLAVVGSRELLKIIPEPSTTPARDVHRHSKSATAPANDVTSGAKAPPRSGGSAHIKARAESPHKGEHLFHLDPPFIRHAYKGTGIRVVDIVQVVNNNARDG